MNVGEQVLYCKVLNDKTTEEIVDIISIDYESNSATIYIPSLKRERDTDISRLNKIKKKNMLMEIPKRIDLLIPKLIFKCVIPQDVNVNNTLKDYILMGKIHFDHNPIINYETDITVNSYRTGLRLSIKQCSMTMSSTGFLYNTVCELYKEVDSIHEIISVLVSNQNKLCSEIESLKEELHQLKQSPYEY
jgi:hypothetical protein